MCLYVCFVSATRSSLVADLNSSHSHRTQGLSVLCGNYFVRYPKSELKEIFFFGKSGTYTADGDKIKQLNPYIYEGERQTRLNVPNVSDVPTFHLNVCPVCLGRRSAANLPCLGRNTVVFFYRANWAIFKVSFYISLDVFPCCFLLYPFQCFQDSLVSN